jgi:hypothetical protein
MTFKPSWSRFADHEHVEKRNATCYSNDMKDEKLIPGMAADEAVRLIINQFQPLPMEEIYQRLQGMVFEGRILCLPKLNEILGKLERDGVIVQTSLRQLRSAA